MSSTLYCQKTLSRLRSDYNSPLLQYANRNRNKGYFDDITIGAGQSNFKANRMVLCCYSTFFEEKLKVNEKFHESVSIDDIDKNSFKAVIDFIYSGEITIDQDNVINLLNAGHQLKVVELKEFCFEYLKSVVNSENCFYLLDTANRLHNDSLKSKVYHHMSQNIHAVIQSLEFKKLSKQNIADFFSTLNENEFGNITLQYEAIVTWTKHNEAERKIDFPDLFHLLKLDVIPKDYLASVVSRESLVHENDACAKLVMGKLAQMYQQKVLKFNKSSIICLGGWKTRSKVAEVYNLSGETQKHYPDLPVGLDKSCTVKMNNNIVCIGGDTSGNWDVSNQVWKMDLMEDRLQWKEITSMNVKRFTMAAAIYLDSLVVAGGSDGKKILSSTETLTKQSNQWNVISSLNQGRGNHALVANESCLFALGGSDWDQRNILSSVERLSGLDEEWEFIQPMNSPRFDFAAVSCQNKVFAIGGLSTKHGKSAMKSVELFHHSIQKWTEVKSMNVERCGHTACVLQDKIYVIGGRNKHGKIVKEIECYDVTSDNWTNVANTIDEWHWNSSVAL